MPVTATAVETLKSALNEANPNKIADALAKVDIGTVLSAVEYDTGTITGAVAVTLPGQGALLVQSVVVMTGTESATPHIVVDSAQTAGQIGSTGIYTVKLSANGKVLTFAANVTRIIVRYIPNSAADLSAAFERA
jgi:hypothetical protein